MNTGLPVFIPNPPVCRMPQYRNCSRCSQCRLHTACSQTVKQTVCKMDCPTCGYDGCSLARELRQSAPVYVQNVIQGDRLHLNLEGQFWQQQAQHRLNHRQRYAFYNDLFGDRKERRREQNRARYWKDPEHARQLARESYRRRYVPHPKAMDGRFIPECQLQCDHCLHPDCVLPVDWCRKAYYGDFRKRHPEYFQQYQEAHHDERIAYNRQYYIEHQSECLARQKAHRQKPEVKAQRAAYDRAYRQTPAGKESLKRRKAKYYEKHKNEINARRREQRNAARRSVENTPHGEV